MICDGDDTFHPRIECVSEDIDKDSSDLYKDYKDELLSYLDRQNDIRFCQDITQISWGRQGVVWLDSYEYDEIREKYGNPEYYLAHRWDYLENSLVCGSKEE